MAIVVLLSVTIAGAQNKNQAEEFNTIFNNYFQLKDALVKSGSKAAATASAELLSALKNVKMESLSDAEHTARMKVMKQLKEDAASIAKTTDIGNQRNHFITLSKGIYELQKVSKTETPVYYQFCPMANNGKGANWLSRDSAIKNPYYGSQMLNCGKTIETIK